MIANCPTANKLLLRFILIPALFFIGTSDLTAKKISKPIIRFGIISDCHYADREPAGTRYYRQSIGKLNEAIEKMNQEKVDFVIELGDFKDQDATPDETKTLGYLQTIETVFQNFKGPTYHVLGNHDMDGISKQQFLGIAENTGIPKGKSYYSFNRKGFHFIVLDGNFTKEQKNYDHGNFSWDDACISDQELEWLKADLEANRLPVIVFIHQMLDDSKNPKQAVQNAPEVRKILENSGKVIAVFQGHVHEERYNLINKIHYYSVNALVEGPNPEDNSYCIVEAAKNKDLKIRGFRKSTDREFKAVPK